MSLFQTNAWQGAWWDTWGPGNGLELIRGWGDGRSAIYTSAYRIGGILPTRSIEFVGGSYRRFGSTRTEYNTFFASDGCPDSAIDQLEELLDTRPWGEAIFSDLLASSVEAAGLRSLASNKGWLIRITAADTAWQVTTDRSFDDYLGSLGRNTRLRLFNRRKVLESLGRITHENVFQEGVDPRGFFDLINQFHKRRWGKPAYDDQALSFNTAFLERVVAEGGEPQLRTLRSDGKLLSVLYNVKYRGCIYNLQSGFEEDFHQKLAIGTLHLGYAIEHAFGEEDVSSFDMLAGNGKNENYKERIATASQPLLSLMVVRNPLLKLLYRMKDSWT